MATIVLQAVGSAIGAAVGGPVGAVVGRTLGAIGGAYIDQQLFGPGDRHVNGPRLENAQVLSSREGAAVPQVYGRARVSGEVIWATRFDEVQSVERQSQGGKGGAPKSTVTSYSYFANFAVGLCEGEIATIGRIWADGKLIDQTDFTLRLHKGDEQQLPDSLIEAKQDPGNAPAYRGTAYLVFEDFPLENFGNRIPQIAVEIIRPIGMLEKRVYGVNVIPGSTEFGYDTQVATKAVSQSEQIKVNVNQSMAITDFVASLDELVSVCPNLKQVALVVTWFGTDLRAGHCQIRPGVESRQSLGFTDTSWSVSGISRLQAHEVSKVDGNPAFGGTPSDASVVRAIQEIKSRGLQVCITPFIMMDIPVQNGLNDPYGEAEQAVYSWRGRITCDPAPQQSATVDQTAAARSQLEIFTGTALSSQFQTLSSGVNFTGAEEWSYRRMILHYAHLADLAGGVDMFLIGSEMRGLTSVRANGHSFPFIEHLAQLADDVAAIAGPNCLITYGADWSEYFGYHPQDGSQNVYFSLDTLWSRASIGAVGIDNYMPLSDWRPDSTLPDAGRISADIFTASNNIAGGEGFDWYYESYADRSNGIRSPITDGLGKPWVFRYKDLVGWWSNQHYTRLAGAELQQPTPWLPKCKPIIFTEFGCPAVHNGLAQPNVFVDPKSSESHFPYFSNRGRDDDAQSVYIAAHQKHWDQTHPEFVSANNPTSPVYGGPMVDIEKSQLWAWDARPYPAFPALTAIWSDASNWSTGHWLNGRMGSLRLADLIVALVSKAGLSKVDVSKVTGMVDGYVVAETGSTRSALEFIVNLYQIAVHEDAGVLKFSSPGKDPVLKVGAEDRVQLEKQALLSSVREQRSDLPISAHARHIDPGNDFQEAETFVQRTDQPHQRQQWFSGPLVLGQERLRPVLENWLKQRWVGQDTVQFAVPPRRSELTVGDQIAFEDSAFAPRYEIEEIEERDVFVVSAKAIETREICAASNLKTSPKSLTANRFGKPHVIFMDLPLLPDMTGEDGNKVAVTTVPWSGVQNIYASHSGDEFNFVQSIENSAFTGELLADLAASHTTSRHDNKTTVLLKLRNGTLSSISQLAMLNGANTAFVRSTSGAWEVLQFTNATLIAEKTWRLSGLLRGQAGTEVEASLGANQGADIVIYNEAVESLNGAVSIRGLETSWLVGPQGKEIGSVEFSQVSYAPGRRAMVPYSPVHLTASFTAANYLEITWIRRDRRLADDWSLLEIPMSETTESYTVVLKNAETEWSAIRHSPSITILQSLIVNTFGTGLSQLEIEVSQISATVGNGPSATLTIDLT